MYETWSYKGISAFSVSSSITPQKLFLETSGFPTFVRCDGKDGRDKNGYCELAGPKRTEFNTLRTPYSGTVQDIDLTPVSRNTAFMSLLYQGITKGGVIYYNYWDYRNSKWNSDDYFTLKAFFKFVIPVKLEHLLKILKHFLMQNLKQSEC